MPTYNMHCTECDAEFEVTQSIHDELPDHHLVATEDLIDGVEGAEFKRCGPIEQVISVPVIHGVGGAAARQSWQRDRERDIEAYRRLRKNGVQPKGVNGCAELEVRAGEKHEVEHDVIFEDRAAAHKLTEAHAEAKEIIGA